MTVYLSNVKLPKASTGSVSDSKSSSLEWHERGDHEWTRLRQGYLAQLRPSKDENQDEYD